ncbi:MAG: metallophosphoesterase [Methanocellales archaeon]|nr:metallophosphoesterase [Methanocellales archaeon]MDD3292315.1 metallophosphoesterase [Methanocellales archaeon]MDD5485779.1 metallophosphoesterase [Methanocellales archaeon]
MGKHTPLLVLSCLAIALLLLASPAQASTIWYVDDDGGADFTTIQDAVNASAEGDTIIVRDGTYYENVVVNKSLTIKSENGSDAVAVIAAVSSTPVFDVNANNVTIEGFAVSGPTDEHVAGIELVDANSCTIVNNDCSGCYNGIHLGGTATNDTVTSNYCHDNTRRGISLRDDATGNFVSENTCENNADDEICIKDQTHDNFIWLNDFMGSVECLTDNTYHSPTQLAYNYEGAPYTNYLGNYYSGYAGVDSDGDGIGDTPYSFDDYPLMEPFENYTILTSVIISPSSATLYPCNTQQFTATAYDQNHEEMSGIVVTWSSSNETVGTITENGLFEANATGTATVTAANGTVNGTAMVLVIPAPITLWGPYVTKTTTNSTVINWKTENATSGVVSYATDAYYQEHGGYDHAVEDTEEKELHHLNITNLTPNTVYHYQVCIGNESTSDCTFRTFSTQGSFTFIVYSDSQEPQGDPEATQLTRHKLVADRIAEEENVMFVLHCGDLVNDGSDLEEWNRFFEAGRAMMSTTTFYTTLGNHDYHPVQNYYDAFGVPEWYSFDCGNAHFTVLDSNDQADVNSETTWLQNDLTTSAAWKFVSFHHPPYSSSASHYGGWANWQSLWCPIFLDHDVNAVFNGHVHAYERLQADGINYVVAGIGGGPSYDLAEPRIPESQNSLEGTLGYVKITIDVNQATLEMIEVANLSSGEVELYPPNTVFETFTFGALLGDVNNDGIINVLDATKVKNRAGNPFYPLDNEWAADVNSDGIINVLDATKVKNRAADPNYPW